ncbi:MAG: hypothetical protein PXX73_06865 [Sideroxydans sp.]|nr:hypothetical protein [Sideroxydans sp.]
MTNKLWWWEKTVEYTFVRKILADNSIACPMAGKPEKWMGDLIEQIQDEFRLIEFKRDEDSIKDENKKYDNTKQSYLTSCKDIPKREDAAHWLVFGEEVTSKDKPTMQLRYRHYHSKGTDSSDSNLNKTDDLLTMKYQAFLKYINELMDLRGATEGASGGLVMAGVGDEQTTVMDLNEFIALVPQLDNKFSPSAPSSYDSPPSSLKM